MTQRREADEVRRRRLLWRAGHRGMRELDLLLGAYAREHVFGMDSRALEAFEALLLVPDGELLDWIMGRTATPVQYQGPILDALKTLRLEPRRSID
jgi:antitoxin CptB